MKYPIRFAKYLLLERVNVGGMAEVFKAKAFGVEGFQRFLAIKRILPNMSEDEEFIRMFVDEARLAVQLNHANIVQIYELGKHESQFYIAMEYVAGKDLRRIVEWYRKRKQVMPVPLAAYICSKICEGLDYAHRKLDAHGNPINLVHRDVSPQNILVSYEGDVKVIDFGIAKAADRLSKTQAGVLKGKFGYMSPEQVAGNEIDRRSDLFAVGVLLYEMLTCQRLFVAETDFSTLEKVRQCDVPPMRERNEGVPDELEQVVRKALNKNLDERYQWCSDFNEDLQRFLIVDNTIFNAKRLASFMKETFREDIDTEMQRMQEFAKIQDTDVSNDQFTNSGSAGGNNTNASQQQDNDFGSQRTEIFDINNVAAAGAATAVGSLNDIMSGGSNGTKRLPSSDSGSNDQNLRATREIDSAAVADLRHNTQSGTVESKHTVVAKAGTITDGTSKFDPVEPVEQSNKRMFMILGAAVAVALTIIGLAVYFSTRKVEPETTWVFFNIDPLGVPIEVYVDDQEVAKATTPIEKRKLPAGKHRLLIKPTGYQEYKGEVEFKEDTTNEVGLKLKPVVAVPPVAPGASGEVVGQQPTTPPPTAQPTTPPPTAQPTNPPPTAQPTTPPPTTPLVQQPPHTTKPKTTATPKEPKQPPPPTSGAIGFIIVNTPSEPGTKIILDGRDTKRETPVPAGDPIKTGAGKHVVTLVFKDGTKRNVPIQVNAGNPPFKLIERK